MGRVFMIILAILAIVIGALQYTPLRFLSPDAIDFVWGLAGGLAIGAMVAWFASPPNSVGR